MNKKVIFGVFAIVIIGICVLLLCLFPVQTWRITSEQKIKNQTAKKELMSLFGPTDYSVDSAQGVFAAGWRGRNEVGGSPTRYIAMKKDGVWSIIYEGSASEQPLCAAMDFYGVPKDIYGECH